jgi:hypothetical protein
MPRRKKKSDAETAAEEHASDVEDALEHYDLFRDANELLTPAMLAKRWKTTSNALAKQRSRGGGPPFVCLNRRRLAYRLSDIQIFEANRIAYRTGEAKAVGLI